MKPPNNRRAKRQDKLKKDKDLLAIDRRRGELLKAKHTYKLVKLEKPIPWGFRKKYVLREDLKGRPDIKVLREILAEINNTIYARDNKFERYNWTKGRKEPMQFGPKSIELSKWKFPDSYKRFFDVKTKEQVVRNAVFREKRFYFKFEWMLVEKIEPHFATHLILVDGDLESELKRLDNHLNDHGGWIRLAKLHGYAYTYKDRWGSGQKGRAANDLRKEIRQGLDEYYEGVE